MDRTPMVLILVVFAFVHKQHSQLLSEVRPGKTVQEKVDAIIHIKDSSGNEHDVDIPRHLGPRIGDQQLVAIHLLDKPRQQMLLTPYGGVRCIEGDKTKRNSDEDDSELQANYALLSDHLTLSVMLVSNKECTNYHGIQDGNDNKGEKDDTKHKNTVQYKAHVLVVGVCGTYFNFIRPHLNRGRHAGLVYTENHSETYDRRDDFSSGVHVTERFSFQCVTDSDVPFKSEADDDPGGQKPRDVLHVDQDLTDAILFEKWRRGNAGIGRD